MTMNIRSVISIVFTSTLIKPYSSMYYETEIHLPLHTLEQVAMEILSTFFYLPCT